MPDGAAQPSYVLGHAERELARLEVQAGFFAEGTRDGLIKAGLRTGMRVLDVGSGVGDVAMIAAEIVGPTGHVTGIDISAGAVGLAQARADRQGLKISFQNISVEQFESFDDYDIVIGRFILVHFADPSAIVRTLRERVKKGTPIVFMEMDMSTASSSAPFPLFDTSLDRIRQVYLRMGLNPDMGTKLHATYRNAGLGFKAAGFTRVGHRDESAGFDFLAESVRSLLPAMEKLGICSADDVDVDTLSGRLAAEAQSSDPAIFYPRFVVAWADA